MVKVDHHAADALSLQVIETALQKRPTADVNQSLGRAPADASQSGPQSGCENHRVHRRLQYLRWAGTRTGQRSSREELASSAPIQSTRCSRRDGERSSSTISPPETPTMSP